jgi:DNA-binding XRE family transcriptional regulator
MPEAFTVERLPTDYSERIKRVRGRLGLTQTQFADLLGVSFTTVNRWENRQSRPSQLAWSQIEQLVTDDAERSGERLSPPPGPPLLDFTSSPDAVLSFVEGERLSFGHLANPAFATRLRRSTRCPTSGSPSTTTC